MNNEQLVARIQSGDNEAENMLQLWRQNKAFVAMIARRYSAGAEMEDLEQEGYIYPVKGRGNFVADTAELSQKEQASLLEAAKTLMDRGRALGITKAQYLDLVNDVYRKGEEL